MDIISTFNSSFTINRLTEAQYQAAKNNGEISGYNEFEFYLTEGDSGGGGGSIYDYLSSEEWIFTMDDSSTRTVKMAVWKN